MKLSSFDLGSVKPLHHLLEEAHVGRAARLLGITPAAASNALRRLRADFGDPLLIKKGRGLTRTRIGEELREPVRAVMTAAARLEQASRPFDPMTFQGQLSIALSDHVAAVLLPELDRLMREQAPAATLMIAPIPDQPKDWLERTGGVMVSPLGASTALADGNNLAVTPFYEDHYVVAMRSDHPLHKRRWSAAAYAAAEHVLVVPRGKTAYSDIDDQLAGQHLSRRVVRVVPSFTLALSLVAASDRITTIPELYAQQVSLNGIVLRNAPLALRPLAMTIAAHRTYENDATVRFTTLLLKAAQVSATRDDQRG